MNTHVETFTAAVERMERKAAERDVKMIIWMIAIVGVAVTALGIYLSLFLAAVERLI